MMYDEILELIEAIKQEDCFLRYQESLTIFENEDVRSLMRQLNRLTEEKESLARFGKYANTQDLTQKMADIRRELYQKPEMQAYLEAYGELNKMLDEITNIVFDNISDELAKGRIGRSYARYSR